MQFVDYLPDEFKETVNFIRIKAVDNSLIRVASNVVCWIEPDSTVSGNQVVVEEGVSTHYLLYTAHLAEPIPNITEGDRVVRSTGEEIPVMSVRTFGDPDIMQLILRDKKVL